MQPAGKQLRCLRLISALCVSTLIAMTEKTPIDLKIVSIFLFLSAFSYFTVNTNINFIFGATISGPLAKALWGVSCLICVIGAYGLWSKNPVIWKIVFVYAIFYMINSTLNFLLITSHDRMQIVPPVDIPNDFEPSSGLIFFVSFLCIQLGFILYLYKRKSLFKGRNWIKY